LLLILRIVSITLASVSRTQPITIDYWTPYPLQQVKQHVIHVRTLKQN